MLHEDRRRAGSFGEDADRYDRARPSYPPALIDDLASPAVRRVLDVGCGTGIAARLFAARGCDVRGVEPDARMARVARRHGVEVDVASFEAWEPPHEPFDLVVSAQSWHWIDPAVGVPKVARALRPGGRFAAFWNAYRPPPHVRTAFAAVYRRHAPHLLDASLPLATPSSPDHDPTLAHLAASGLFTAAAWRTYPWSRVYERDALLDQLPTHSDHRTLPAGTLAAIVAGIGAVIDQLGGQLTIDHTTSVVSADRVR